MPPFSSLLLLSLLIILSLSISTIDAQQWHSLEQANDYIAPDRIKQIEEINCLDILSSSYESQTASNMGYLLLSDAGNLFAFGAELCRQPNLKPWTIWLLAKNGPIFGSTPKLIDRLSRQSQSDDKYERLIRLSQQGSDGMVSESQVYTLSDEFQKDKILDMSAVSSYSVLVLTYSGRLLLTDSYSQKFESIDVPRGMRIAQISGQFALGGDGLLYKLDLSTKSVSLVYMPSRTGPFLPLYQYSLQSLDDPYTSYDQVLLYKLSESIAVHVYPQNAISFNATIKRLVDAQSPYISISASSVHGSLLVDSKNPKQLLVVDKAQLQPSNAQIRVISSIPVATDKIDLSRISKCSVDSTLCLYASSASPGAVLQQLYEYGSNAIPYRYDFSNEISLSIFKISILGILAVVIVLVSLPVALRFVAVCCRLCCMSKRKPSLHSWRTVILFGLNTLLILLSEAFFVLKLVKQFDTAVGTTATAADAGTKNLILLIFGICLILVGVAIVAFSIVKIVHVWMHRSVLGVFLMLLFLVQLIAGVTLFCVEFFGLTTALYPRFIEYGMYVNVYIDQATVVGLIILPALAVIYFGLLSGCCTTRTKDQEAKTKPRSTKPSTAEYQPLVEEKPISSRRAAIVRPVSRTAPAPVGPVEASAPVYQQPAQLPQQPVYYVGPYTTSASNASIQSYQYGVYQLPTVYQQGYDESSFGSFAAAPRGHQQQQSFGSFYHSDNKY